MKHLFSVLLFFAVSSAVPAAEPFELKDGDRVVLIGNTLIEREQKYGYWEAALTSRWPDRNITFRNLGWSGDTVWGEARAAFDSPAQGFKRLVDHTLALKPTVIIVGYGGNESFAGLAGLKSFTEGLQRLLDALAPAKARLVFLTPAPLGLFGHNRSLGEAYNANLALYRKVLESAAARSGHHFADLWDISVTQVTNWRILTDNGLHLTEQGYHNSAPWLEKALGLPMVASKLPRDQAEKLRQTIIVKNEQFFHRYRPQNETYLFGFRKHEQGKNAAEIPLFDPVVEKLEKEIARLRKPVPHTYELKRDEK